MATTSAETNHFTELAKIDVRALLEKKNGLSYLPWADSWELLKRECPFATYEVHENDQGWPYFTDGKTAWVKVSVTVPYEDAPLTHTIILPIMDYRNNSIPAEKVTSMDFNKAIQRAIVKATALHGLGLQPYKGEDLPEEKPRPRAAASGSVSRKARVENFCAMKKTTTAAFGKWLVERQKDPSFPQGRLNDMAMDDFDFVLGSAAMVIEFPTK